MKSLLGYAVFGGALGLVDAKALKWSPDSDEKRWAPPQETLGFMPALGMNGVDGPPAPAPTSPPILEGRHLQKRSATDNTCGYINGIESNSMWCPTSQFCAYNSINSHIGCCDDASSKVGCNVWTTCLASSESTKYMTDNGLTLWCGFTDYPNCLTHLYQGSASGYTLLGCGVAAGTDKIFIEADTSSSSSEEEESTTNGVTSTKTPTTTTTRPNGLGPNATNPPVPQSSTSSSTPIGPIVGGVVGGVAAIALIAFGIFFLVRSNNKRKGNIAPPTAAVPPPAAPPAAGQAPPPQMTQHHSYYDPSGAGFAHLDPRASIAKPPYYDQGISPPSSPPPPAHSPAPMYNAQQNNTPSPPPGGYAQSAYSPQGQGQGQYSPQQQHQGMYSQQGSQQGGAYSPQQQQQQPQGYPQQQQQEYSPQQQQQQPQYGGYQHQQQSPPQQFVAELPTQRGDGEVRELAA